MQSTVITSFGRPVELWSHPDPDHIGRVIRGTRTFYELDLLLKCRELYWPGATVIDVGASIGNHTIFFAAVLGARVHAIEPYPPNIALLGLNVSVNGLANRVCVHAVAAGADAGTGEARASGADNLGRVRVAQGPGSVAIQPLDSLEVDGPVGLVKIDVEGAELAVLDGARGTISRWLPDVVAEAGTPADFGAVASRLLDWGYTVHGRFGATATYLFRAEDQRERSARLLTARHG